MSFCSYCGNQLSSDSSFCDNCGAKIISWESVGGQGKVAPKKAGKPLLIIVLIAILLTVSVGLTFAIVQGNSPKNMYLKALANGFSGSVNPVKQVFGENPDLLKRIATDAYRNEITISGDTNTPIDGISLRNSSIGVTTSVNPKKSQGMASIAIRRNGANVFQLEAFQSDDNTGIRLPYLYENYYYVENNRFGRFMEQLDPYYSGPAKLNNFLARHNAVAGKDFLEPYFKYIASFLRKEHFTLEKGFNFQGEKYNKVTLNLSESEVKCLLIGLVDKLSNDQGFFDLYAGILQLQGQGFYGFDWEQKLKDSLKALTAEIEMVSFPNGFRSELIIDDKNNIVHCLTTLDVADAYFPEDITNLLFETTNRRVKDKTDSNRKLTISDSQSNVEISWDSVSQADKAQTDIVVTVDGEADLTFKMVTSITGSTRETNFVLHSDDGWDSLHISGTISHALDQNLKRDYSNQDIHLAANIREEDYYWGDSENISFSLDIKSKIEFTKNLDFPTLSPSAATNVTDLSEHELAEILDNISISLEQLLY